jgi:hypothetical protein
MILIAALTSATSITSQALSLHLHVLQRRQRLLLLRRRVQHSATAGSALGA